MKSGDKLPAVFVNVLTKPTIKLHLILDSRAAVYNCQFQFHLMPFSMVWVKLVVSWVLAPWYQCPTTFTLPIITRFFIWFCNVIGLLQFKLIFSMPSICLRYCQTVPSTSENLRENSVSVLYLGEPFLSEVLAFPQEKGKRLEIWQEEASEARICLLLHPGIFAQIWPSYKTLKNDL